MSAPARDTRTHGQRRHDDRSFGPSPRRRRNRDIRPVLRIQWRPVGWYFALLAVSMWLASDQARPVWTAIWGQS